MYHARTIHVCVIGILKEIWILTLQLLATVSCIGGFKNRPRSSLF